MLGILVGVGLLHNHMEFWPGGFLHNHWELEWVGVRQRVGTSGRGDARQEYGLEMG